MTRMHKTNSMFKCARAEVDMSVTCRPIIIQRINREPQALVPENALLRFIIRPGGRPLPSTTGTACTCLQDARQSDMPKAPGVNVAKDEILDGRAQLTISHS